MQCGDFQGGEVTPREPFVGRLIYGSTCDSDEFVILAAARAVVTLPASKPRRIQSRVWKELDAEAASTETVVQSIPLLGSDAVASFSVVVVEPEADGRPRSITVVVRGDAAVDVCSVGGSARVSANGLVPWPLVTFSSVCAVAVGAGVTGGRREVWQIDPEFSVAALEAGLAGQEGARPGGARPLGVRGHEARGAFCERNLGSAGGISC